MKFWDKNWNIPAFLIFNILLFTFLFFYDLNRNVNMDSFESIGTVSFKMNSILRKFDSTIVWHPLFTNSPLKNRDTIKSYLESDAILSLNNGTEVKMDEESMIYLDMIGNTPNINFEGGSVQIKNSKGNNPNQEVSVKAKNQIIKLTGSDAIFESSKDGKSINISLDKGSALIEGNGKSQKVNVNEVATIGESGVTTRKAPFLLLEPENQKKFIITNFPVPISFHWKPLGSNLNDITFEISKIRSFKRIDAKIKNNSSANMKLSRGSYYWRIQGKNSTGQLQYSETRKIAIINESGLKLFSPSNGSSIPYTKGNTNINFSWTASSTVNEYILEISSNNSFTSNRKSIPINTNFITKNNLSKGRYFWRVITKPATMSIPIIISPVNTFTISSTGEMKLPLEIIAPSEKTPEEKNREETKTNTDSKKNNADSDSKKKNEMIESISNLQPQHISPLAGKIDILKKKQIHFYWDKVKYANHYTIKIFEANKKVKLIITEKVTANSFVLKNFSRLSEGNFIWDVTPFDKVNKQGKTARGKFTIDIGDDNLKKIKPEEIEILSPDTIYRDK